MVQPFKFTWKSISRKLVSTSSGSIFYFHPSSFFSLHEGVQALNNYDVSNIIIRALRATGFAELCTSSSQLGQSWPITERPVTSSSQTFSRCISHKSKKETIRYKLVLCFAGVDRAVTASLSDARDALLNAVVDPLKSFKETLPQGLASGGVYVPQCLRLFPLYMQAMLKHVS